MLVPPKLAWKIFWWRYFTTIAGLGFKNTTMTEQHKTVGVHEFQQLCALQLGDPQNRQVGAGIVISANTSVPQAAGVKGKGGVLDFGVIEIIQNVNYTYRRAPPKRPQPGVNQECATSNRSWQRDGAPVTAPVRGPGAFGISYKDSPAVFLSDNGLAFEIVSADAKFRTYFSWVSATGIRIPLARLDWSWKGEAVCAQGATDCQDVVAGIRRTWGLTKSSGVVKTEKVRTGFAMAFDRPVLSPAADPTDWKPC